MLKFVEFIQKRPKDCTIRSVRALYAVALASLLVLAGADYSLPFAAALGEPNATYAEYALAALVLVPGIVAAGGWCVAKRKHVRMAQLAGSLFLFVLSATITAAPSASVQTAVPTNSGTLSASELATASAPKNESSPVNVSGWLKLFAFLALFSGITGKMVTEKCLKHGEVIKKIRV